MLKYENIPNGARIRAFDFRFSRDAFVEGIVNGQTERSGAKFLVIDCLVDGDQERDPSRVGEEILVPCETLFEESWKQPRVEILENQ